MIGDQLVMEQGKGLVVHHRNSTLAMAQKPGNWKILVVSSLPINDAAVIKANKSGTIRGAAQWTNIAKQLVIFNDI